MRVRVRARMRMKLRMRNDCPRLRAVDKAVGLVMLVWWLEFAGQARLGC